MSLGSRSYLSEGKSKKRPEEGERIIFPGPPEYKEGEDKAHSFVNKVRSLSLPHPFMRGHIIFDGTVVLDIRRYPEAFKRRVHTVYFGSIQSLDPGKGVATTAMRKLLRLAQEFDVAIEGTVKPIGKSGLNKKELTAWYKRLGFKIKGGEARWSPK